MIYDTLCKSAAYTAINPLFGAAFDYLQNLPAQIADGRYPIVGDDCYAIIYTADLKATADAKLEIHDCYIDIQTVLEGTERFGIAPRAICQKPIGAIDTEKDILFFDDAPTNFIDVRRGEFAIFMPDDAHAPLMGNGKVRKVVIKVIHNP